MLITKKINFFILLFITLHVCGCVPEIVKFKANKILPKNYLSNNDSSKEKDDTSVSQIKWKAYFSDPHLTSLIEIALEKNQELNIFVQELNILKNEVSVKKGAYLPSVELSIDAGVDKVGEFTRNGAVEENLNIDEGKKFPDPLKDFSFGLKANWEIDIWRKLRNAEKSALMKYLASKEGRNFLQTNLIAEIANTYFELLSLDNQLLIVDRNIKIQNNALKAVRVKKRSARLTELALKRFEALVFKTKSIRYEIKQKIIEKENKLNFLIGRYPKKIKRDSKIFTKFMPKEISTGVPSELLKNRPDIKEAKLNLLAAELDIDVAEARFYPSLRLSGSYGQSAYDTERLLETPQSIMYSLVGGLTLPFINRRDIEALYLNASAKQKQTVINYELTVLKAFMEVVNQLSNIKNLVKNYNLKKKQVKALEESVNISILLFNSARADYTEVLLTQREALDSEFDLIETKERQLHAAVNIYRALGGGWN